MSKNIENSNVESREVGNTSEDNEMMAAIGIMPSANAAAVIQEYCTAFGKQDSQVLVNKLSDSAKKVIYENDLKKCEAMLVGQAEALQAIFVNLSRRAIKQEYIQNLDTFLRLALKAQNQCRVTLETLATIKNPPIVYAKQANIAHGHQQVNNQIQPMSKTSRVRKNKIQQNELLEVQK